MKRIKCIKCQEAKKISEINWHTNKGYCRLCYYEKYEKSNLSQNNQIAKEITNHESTNK